EAVVRGERAAFDRLRADLDDMANTVALARSALATFAIKPDGAPDGKGGDVNALLQTIEDRVKAMVAFIGNAGTAAAEPPPAATGKLALELPPAAPAAEPDRVPTVSDVVTQLGRDVETPAAETSAESAPSVAALQSMVEALAASMPEAAPAVPEPAAV